MLLYNDMWIGVSMTLSSVPDTVEQPGTAKQPVTTARFLVMHPKT